MAKKELWGLREAARELQMPIDFLKKLVLLGQVPVLDEPVEGTIVRDGFLHQQWPGQQVPADADTPLAGQDWPTDRFRKPLLVPTRKVVPDTKHFEAQAIKAWGPKWRARWNEPCAEPRAKKGAPCVTVAENGVHGRPNKHCKVCGGTGDGQYRRDLGAQLERFARPAVGMEAD